MRVGVYNRVVNGRKTKVMTMDLQLMRLRKLAGYKSRDAFAEKLGVNKYTYRSWESGAAMMSLEQACDVVDILGCTLEELVGREPIHSYTDARQQLINDAFENSNDAGRDYLASSAEAVLLIPRYSEKGNTTAYRTA